MTPALSQNGQIRVVVADDSPTMRELLVALVDSAPNMHVVGTGANGEEALRLTRRLKPDVVTLDVRMPRMDGLEATRRIMQECPTPIVIVSGSILRSDVDLTLEALRAGALTVVRKPGLADATACHDLIEALRLMAGVPVVHRWRRAESSLPRPALVRPPAPRIYPDIIGIAASTGGPAALATVLKALPADFALPMLVVQHVTRGFTGGLAEWLAGETRLRVRLAQQGHAPRPGEVLLAPDDRHLEITRQGTLQLSQAAPYKGLRPSANVLFESLAAAYGARATGVILTGMGDDGADGLLALHRAGGRIYAQNEASCVVYGMPREAVLRGAVDEELPLKAIASVLAALAVLPQQKGIES
jgi:two-component system chemotaxis response regulator CheB